MAELLYQAVSTEDFPVTRIQGTAAPQRLRVLHVRGTAAAANDAIYVKKQDSNADIPVGISYLTVKGQTSVTAITINATAVLVPKGLIYAGVVYKLT